VLSSADVDLAVLADQVVRSRSRALSFCLSGPPGTGKSAYARCLAERLELEILEKPFSDLTSMYLGESEKAIVAAFEEAADLRAFLILDEADSLLHDRRAARHSREITQVNEMLTQMESHPYHFACTANAPELLDAAVLVQGAISANAGAANRRSLSSRVWRRCAGLHPQIRRLDVGRVCNGRNQSSRA
jgi:SpoVK/Ycf46/Vps4 family AAA+-type ATPase